MSQEQGFQRVRSGPSDGKAISAESSLRVLGLQKDTICENNVGGQTIDTEVPPNHPVGAPSISWRPRGYIIPWSSPGVQRQLQPSVGAEFPFTSSYRDTSHRRSFAASPPLSHCGATFVKLIHLDTFVTPLIELCIRTAYSIASAQSWQGLPKARAGSNGGDSDGLATWLPVIR